MRNQADRPAIVYVDPLTFGHRTEHLAFYLRVCADANLQLCACVPKRLWDAAVKLAGAASESGEHTLDLENHANTLNERYHILQRVRQVAGEKSASLIYFPLLDDYMLPLLYQRLTGGSPGAPISGVFFRDEFNYIKEDISRPKHCLVSLCRGLVLQLILMGRSPTLFTFNRHWRLPLPVPVTWLPDALSSLDEMAAAASEQAGWPVPNPEGNTGSRLRFLIFGAMKPRKGLTEILEAILALSDEEVSRVELRALGRFEGNGSYRAQAGALFEKFLQRGGAGELTDMYVTEAVLDGALRRCDFVLAPYFRHPGSSGVMGLAAQYGRPLLSQSVYQVGDDVRHYELGVAVDCHDPDAMIAAFRSMLTGMVAVTPGMKRFRDERMHAHAFSVMRDGLLKSIGQAAQSGFDTKLKALAAP